MSNSAEVATAGAVDSTSRSLSEAQVSAFWDGIVANLDAARRMARRFVLRHAVGDVVHSAAALFIESLQPPKSRPFPKTEEELRGRYLAIVRNHAIDCVRDPERPEYPTHSHWGMVREPVGGGRKVADRSLDRVFARNDDGQYDAPAPAEERGNTQQLDEILRRHVSELPPMQQQVILETLVEGHKRAEIARRLGISVYTYDKHLQAAFRSLRYLLEDDADDFTDVDRSFWYDRIEDLRERHVLARLRRACDKRGDRSTLEGDRSALEGDRGKNAGADAA
ncbi:MAG TPA: sigma factor-like helix-turn-helix DNA-binding protein [Gemmatimonadaceae bacterium]|nr:sigma factor-like helix-turn-helix DNA-binding protein [Gemmatimonadaceae bacterium]